MIRFDVFGALQSARRGLAALGLLLISGSAGIAVAQDGAGWKPESFTLDNGLVAVVLPDHRAPVVTHVIWYRVGSADEAPRQSGLAHFLEHLMFKGTKTTPAGEYARIAARNGGQINARTSYDYTNYFFRVARDRLPQMMRLEADRMVNLKLDDREVIAERSVVQQERRQNVESNPAALLDEEVSARLFAGHPYAMPVVGRMDEVGRLSRADAANWYRTWYGPENAVLVVAGDITAAELRPLAEATYGRIPRRGDLAVRHWPGIRPLTQSFEVVHSDPKVRQAVWSRNWIGAAMGDADAPALQVALQIVGGGRTGRLYRKLVEGGEAVSAWGYSYGMEAQGQITLSVSPSRGVELGEVRREALRVLQEFAAEGPTADELSRAKSILAAAAIYRRDNQQQLADWYGAMLAAGMPLDSIGAWDARIAAVSREDVMAVIGRYMVEAHHVDATLLPEAE